MDFPVSISVLMSTYNTEIPMLNEAVESILNQSFGDFEFIIIDDGSTNDSDSYLKSLSDKRVRIIWNKQNVGITKALNIGLREAKGKYIARMDADDVALPTRFEKEFTFMEQNPDVIVCGARIGVIDENSAITKRAKKAKKPEDMESYRVRMLFQNPGPIHPTAMIRHQMLLDHGITYNENLRYAQDYGLWEATSHYGRICILEEELLYHRHHGNQITIARRDVQMNCDKMTQKKILTDLLGSVTDEEVNLHYKYSTGYFPEAVICPEIDRWYARLIEANRKKRIYDQSKLKKRILTLKKNLIRHTIKVQNMEDKEKRKLVFEYLPFYSAIRAYIGILKSERVS